MSLGAINALARLNPTLAAALLRSRGYGGVAGLPGSPSGPAVMPPVSVLQRPSLITNQPAPALPSIPTLPSFASLTAPNSGPDLGLNIGTPVPDAAARAPQVQAPLNQANPRTTYVSPNTPQPTGAFPVMGLPGTQSGPAPLAAQARNYRAQHGILASDDAATDALNAESLAAAQAGRTYFDRALAAQYGQAPPAGAAGPRTDVVNALLMPPGANQ